MNAAELVLQLIDALNQLSIPYMLVGSLSSNYYGRARSTQDADFVVTLEPGQLDRLRQALGADYTLDPQMSFESVTMTSRNIFTHRSTTFKVEFFTLTNDPHDQLRFARRREVELAGRRVWLPSAEDVIVQKLRWFRLARRAKDLEDLKPILRLRKAELDFDYLRHWTSLHGTQDELEKLIAETGGQK